MFNTLFENALWRVKNSLRFNVLWNDAGTTTNTVYQYIIQIDNRKSPSSFLPTHDIQQTNHYKRKMACKTHLFPMVCKQFSRCLNRHKPFFFFNSNWINFFINNKVKYKRKKKMVAKRCMLSSLDDTNLTSCSFCVNWWTIWVYM